MFAKSFSFAALVIVGSAATASHPGGGPIAITTQQDRSALSALRAADMRLHALHYRMTRANAALCATTVPSVGLVLHARSTYLGRYEQAAIDLFGFRAEIAVEGLVAGATAEAAGVRANDSIVSIDGKDVRQLPSVDAALDAIERDGRDGSVEIGLVGDEGSRTLDLPVEQVCPERIEVQVSSADNAGTDGRTIQVTSELMNRIDADDELAAVAAHELAHAILAHPQRLTAARVSRGLLREFGRNRRLLRQTEQEADRLSVYLLANAGFDPRAAARFWRGAGRRVGGGIFGSGSHMGWRDRAALIEAEIASMAPDAARPILPALLETRGRPLD